MTRGVTTSSAFWCPSAGVMCSRCTGPDGDSTPDVAMLTRISGMPCFDEAFDLRPGADSNGCLPDAELYRGVRRGGT